MVAATGRAEAYYSDTRGEPQELVSAAKYGFLFQGQYYFWQRQRRGAPALELPPPAFIVFLQNHDQVANSMRGLRGHQLTSPSRWRALTALLLLMPGTPMLFQGQEFGASTPFLYFADLDPGIADSVRRGRTEFLEQFASIASAGPAARLDDPGDARTFERCRLDPSERWTHAEAVALHRDLLKLRRQEPALHVDRRGRVDGAVLGPQAFLLRYFAEDSQDGRILIVNLGPDLLRQSFPEPLIAPPPDRDWHIQWSSEDPRYGGNGTPPLRPEGTWHVTAESAIVLAPDARRTLPALATPRRTA
jgi:maltooligosyltrehalose trehalohydrolase